MRHAFVYIRKLPVEDGKLMDTAKTAAGNQFVCGFVNFSAVPSHLYIYFFIEGNALTSSELNVLGKAPPPCNQIGSLLY